MNMYIYGMCDALQFSNKIWPASALIGFADQRIANIVNPSQVDIDRVTVYYRTAYMCGYHHVNQNLHNTHNLDPEQLSSEHLKSIKPKMDIIVNS